MNSYKLTKSEFNAMYSEDTPIGMYRKLVHKAALRIVYVRVFLENTYFDGNLDHALVYNNSIAGIYGFCSRETNRDHGQYDPSEYAERIILVPQVEEGDDDDEFPECKFNLIDIQKYKIEIDPVILYTDFEDEIDNFIKNNGDPEELRRAAEDKLREQYRAELKDFIDSIGGERKWIDNMISFEQWKHIKNL